MGRDRRRRGRGVIGPIMLVMVGLTLLLERNGVISSEVISRWWPLVLVMIGGWMLVERLGGSNDEG